MPDNNKQDKNLLGRKLPKTKRRRLWLVSFGDMSALVLTFFILLFSVSSFDKNVFKSLAHSVSEISRDSEFSRIAETPFIPQDKNIDTRNPRIGLSLNYLYNILSTNFAEDSKLNKIIFTRLDNKLVLSLPSEFIFSSGSATLNSEGVRYLKRLAKSLQSMGNEVQVAGHTDTDPIAGFFPSNWELSLSRAINVGNILEDAGVSTNITASGHSDSYFRLLNVSSDIIDYLARRVDIEILEEIYEK